VAKRRGAAVTGRVYPEGTKDEGRQGRVMACPEDKGVYPTCSSNMLYLNRQPFVCS